VTTRRVPFLPTVVVAVAVLVMMALGFWQIGRAQQRDADQKRMIERVNLPPVAYPFGTTASNAFRFRRLVATCARVSHWEQRASKSSRDQPGWGYIATCEGAAPGATFEAELGFNPAPNVKPVWSGGTVSGRAKLGPDRRGFIDRLLWRAPQQRLMIVSDKPAVGLAASKQPTPGDEDNTSWGYAVQWFLFAATALAIYGLALRKRWRERD
jgi:surfeit locus 1 family protein